MNMLLSVSSILLVVIVLFRHIEFVRGKGRVFELPRRRLDRVTHKVLSAVRRWFRQVVEFVHKDIFLYGIHLVVYIALLFVRIVERWLDRVTTFIRSFRKKRKNGKASEGLREITREGRENEHEE